MWQKQRVTLRQAGNEPHSDHAKADVGPSYAVLTLPAPLEERDVVGGDGARAAVEPRLPPPGQGSASPRTGTVESGRHGMLEGFAPLSVAARMVDVCSYPESSWTRISRMSPVVKASSDSSSGFITDPAITR